ncbi:MAG: ankyrin repeat domain-containing protein [Desulfovibrionaceae bacterium]|nr:ankyrin repeat domain-containing protein [Desulfovibrionaceae bacterium]
MNIPYALLSVFFLFFAAVPVYGAGSATAQPAADPLRSAARSDAFLFRNDQDLLQLLDGGSSASAALSDGTTVLHAALWKGCRRETIRLLLEKGADPRAADSLGRTPLRLAAALADAGTVELLLQNGADPAAADASETLPIHGAARRDNPAALRLLLHHPQTLSARTADGRTPLHEAARSGCAENIRLLLDAGASADLNARTADGRTPLHEAALYGDPASVRLLIARGSDIRAADRFGDTPLHLAAEHSFQAVAMLLEKGAPAAEPSLYGDTPLHRAAFFGRLRSLRALLEKGADPNAADCLGDTPIIYAARAESLQTVSRLAVCSRVSYLAFSRFQALRPKKDAIYWLINDAFYR